MPSFCDSGLMLSLSASHEAPSSTRITQQYLSELTQARQDALGCG
nr:MAG TPA: hypothetical protein [Caudoviricetes sp.]